MHLDPQKTALVLIDLQQGILPIARAPYDGPTVVQNANTLIHAFRQAGARIVAVRVGWSADFGDQLSQPVDARTAPSLPDHWLEYATELAVQPDDIQIIKRQWGAFYGTELELQLRRRGIDTLVLGGISTCFGVESTARDAWERGFQVVIASEICAAADREQHQHSMQVVFPRLARIRDNACLLNALTPPTATTPVG